MAHVHRRTENDREFFDAVARAAFCNPFSDEYATECRRIAGTDDGSAVTAAVVERVARLEQDGTGTMRAYSGDQRETMRLVFLYEAYLRSRLALDGLIEQQLSAPTQSIPVTFAGETTALLRRRGFSADEANRYFAIFYQVRRAAHFIEVGLIGRSPCMKELRRRLWQNVFTDDIRTYEHTLWDRMEDFSTLLLGETGTGKGAAANAIGRSAFIPFDAKRGTFAESFASGFIAVNLSQFSETLIESELFGHRKGAFTGAFESHEGLFAKCSLHGAIFLDEIGELSVAVQIKLLQVLQERQFAPVGSREMVRFRGRIIAATNRSLPELRSQGLFRDDFYYRLCSDAITVPPLRQRIAEDRRELNDLLVHLLGRMTPRSSDHLRQKVKLAIQSGVGATYTWPGNVRELEQAVRRILLTGCYDPEPGRAPDSDLGTTLAGQVQAGTIDAESLLSAYCALLYRRTPNLEEVARRTGLDRRTVKRYLALAVV